MCPLRLCQVSGGCALVLVEGFWKGPAERVRPPYAKTLCVASGCAPE
jgi:hypothetical protein